MIRRMPVAQPFRQRRAQKSASLRTPVEPRGISQSASWRQPVELRRSGAKLDQASLLQGMQHPDRQRINPIALMLAIAR
jgi:hypothetical protein